MVDVSQGRRSLTSLVVGFLLFSTVMMGFLMEEPTLLDELEEADYTGPSGAGLTNASILNFTWLNGSHAYDNLHVGCSSTGSTCGTIVAAGDLILTVNTLTVDSGAMIGAFDFTQSQGIGSSTTLSTSWRGSGAGGAGHHASGGSGGGSSGNGGSSYGVGNETGSLGGDVFDSNGNFVSYGGVGGGRIVIYADSINISGLVTVEGSDGEQGYRYNNGSGPGGPGAGGGSGGSIVMRANDITIGPGSGFNGSILASGGVGGDGADGDCISGTVCLMMYNGGNGGGGGSGGIIDIRANSASNLTISSTATISASSGAGGSGGLPYGTGSAGTSGSSGGAGNSTTGTWAGWSGGSSGGGGGPASASTPDSYEPNDTQATATWGNATTNSAGVNSTSWSGLTIHNSTDEDWFCFWFIESAPFWFTITFVLANGDIAMTLYDGSVTRLQVRQVSQILNQYQML